MIRVPSTQYLMHRFSVLVGESPLRNARRCADEMPGIATPRSHARCTSYPTLSPPYLRLYERNSACRPQLACHSHNWALRSCYALHAEHIYIAVPARPTHRRGAAKPPPTPLIYVNLRPRTNRWRFWPNLEK